MPSEIEKEKIELFYSYSYKDEDLRKELEKHLSILKILGIITDWHFQMIGVGEEWQSEIASHLESANIILLLISSDFLASDYCNKVEVKRAMERHENGEAKVIPVILRPVIWERLPFSKLRALPQNARPITKWQNRDEAFVNVADGIVQVVDELKLRQTKTLEEVGEPGKNPKIVIIEDDQKWLSRMQNMLVAQNYDVEAHYNYSDELLSRLSKDDYDLLITDISLDESENSKGGLKLVKSARESNRNIPIIVTTGYKYDDVLVVVDDLVESKIDYFIAKSNWDPKIFLEAVKGVLKQGKNKSS